MKLHIFILKSVIQFFVSSCFVILTLVLWSEAGGMGSIVIEFLWKGTLASVIGIFVSDYDLYRKKKLSIPIMIIALAITALVCGVDIYVSLFFIDLLKGWMGFILGLFIIEVPAIIVYNLISNQSRKK